MTGRKMHYNVYGRDLDARLQVGQGAPEAAAKTVRRVHGVALLKKEFGDHEDYPLVLDVGVEE